jgi:hypothetical protein
MRTFLHGAALTGFCCSGNAAELKSEPGEGQLRPGEHVLVDDGSRPVGQIKEGVGGSNRSYRTSIRREGSTRSVHCVCQLGRADADDLAVSGKPAG